MVSAGRVLVAVPRRLHNWGRHFGQHTPSILRMLPIHPISTFVSPLSCVPICERPRRRHLPTRHSRLHFLPSPTQRPARHLEHPLVIQQRPLHVTVATASRCKRKFF